MENKMRKLGLWTLAAAFGIVGVQAQQSTLPDTADYPYWVDMMQDPSANFFETQRAFEIYWEGREITPGCGYKPFKRWEEQMRSRVDEEGNRRAPGHVLQAWKSNSFRSTSGNWQPLGPAFTEHTPQGIIPGVGRLNTLEFHPTDPNIIFAGAPSGGLWKTTNAGQSWEVLTDHLPTLGVSAIAIHPDDPDIMYIGTGDRDANDAPGLGVWKSTDGGQTWVESNLGMGETRVHDLIINPDEPEILVAATQIGIYRSEDDGDNWALQGFAFEFKELIEHPTDPDILYGFGAGRFQRSEDNGQTWEMITDGIPAATRMVIAVSKASPDVVYALQANTFDFKGLYRSTNAGMTFTEMSTTPNIMGWSADGTGDGGQAWYDLDVTADPLDADVVYAGGINVWRSSDGGSNWQVISQNKIHVDQHYLIAGPHDDAIYIGNDGGIYRTFNQGQTFEDLSSNMVIGQIYRLGQSQSPGAKLLCGFQDNGTMEGDGVAWDHVLGGDGMECAFDYTDDTYSYGASQYGPIHRRVGDGGFQRFKNGIDEEGAWVTPYILGATDPNTLFLGYKNLWRTQNVKTADKDDIAWTNITNDLVGSPSSNFDRLENSPADSDVLYATKFNRLFRTDNANDAGTVNWTDISGFSPSSSSRITSIETHPTDAQKVYMTRDNKVFRSDDKGLSWVDISGSLPDVSMNTIIYDKLVDEGLYVGSDLGVFYKDATMGDWENFSSGLPMSIEVTEMEIHYGASADEHRLRAATYGRGAWESDLYGNTTTTWPAVATVVRQEPNKPVVGPFEVELGFYRNLDNVDVTGFDVSDIQVVNATLSNFTGGPDDYTVTVTPSGLGTVELSIPVDAATDLDGLNTLESDVLQIEMIEQPASLGIYGPGGVGNDQTLGVWLRGDVGFMDAVGGNPVDQAGDRIGAWMDQSGNGLVAVQADDSARPTLRIDTAGFNGFPAIEIDPTVYPQHMLLDSVRTGKSMTVLTAARSIPEYFNEHAWMGSSRNDNGFIIHNNRNNKTYTGYVRDADGTQINPGGFFTHEIRDPHVYGLNLNQVGTYLDFFTFVDFTERTDHEITTNFEDRSETAQVPVRIGRDLNDRYGHGMIGEFIIYNNRVQRSHLRIIKSYLGAKYNIDMGPDSRYAFQGHHFEVAGIGRESSTDRHEDALGTGMVRMHEPDGLDNGEYLLWGHDNAAVDAWANLPAPENIQRIARTWRVDETGLVGEVRVTVAANDLPATSDLYGIMVSNDENFGGVPLGVVLSPDASGDSLTALVNFPDDSYFTIISGTLESIEGLVSVEEFFTENTQWNLFPNPTTGAFTVRVETDYLQGAAQIELVDGLGRTIDVQQIFGSGDYQWVRDDLPAGLYLVRIVENGQLRGSRKLLVK